MVDFCKYPIPLAQFSLHVTFALSFFDLQYYFHTCYVHSVFVSLYFLVLIVSYLFGFLDVESVGPVVAVELVCQLVKSLVASFVEFVVSHSLIDTFGSCDPTSHECSMFCRPSYNLPVLVDSNAHNSDSCPRMVVVLIVRIVVTALLFANSVVNVVPGIVVLVANYVVESVVFAALVANFVVAVAVENVHFLIDTPNLEHSLVYPIGRSRIVTSFPAPLVLALVY